MTATTVPVVGAIDWRKSSTPAQVTGVDLRIDYYLYSFLYRYCLQCFDAVGWAAGRASGL